MFEKFLIPKLTTYISKVSSLNGNFSAGEQYHLTLSEFFNLFFPIESINLFGSTHFTFPKIQFFFSKCLLATSPVPEATSIK